MPPAIPQVTWNAFPVTTPQPAQLHHPLSQHSKDTLLDPYGPQGTKPSPNSETLVCRKCLRCMLSDVEWLFMLPNYGRQFSYARISLLLMNTELTCSKYWLLICYNACFPVIHSCMLSFLYDLWKPNLHVLETLIPHIWHRMLCNHQLSFSLHFCTICEVLIDVSFASSLEHMLSWESCCIALQIHFPLITLVLSSYISCPSNYLWLPPGVVPFSSTKKWRMLQYDGSADVTVWWFCMIACLLCNPFSLDSLYVSLLCTIHLVMGSLSNN